MYQFFITSSLSKVFLKKILILDPIVKKILDELKFKPEDCLWEKHGATCMKHRYIEIAGQEKGVVIESLDEVEKKADNIAKIQQDIAVIKQEIVWMKAFLVENMDR